MVAQHFQRCRENVLFNEFCAPQGRYRHQTNVNINLNIFSPFFTQNRRKPESKRSMWVHCTICLQSCNFHLPKRLVTSGDNGSHRQGWELRALVIHNVTSNVKDQVPLSAAATEVIIHQAEDYILSLSEPKRENIYSRGEPKIGHRLYICEIRNRFL